jgi:hypothetical protein
MSSLASQVSTGKTYSPEAVGKVVADSGMTEQAVRDAQSVNPSGFRDMMHRFAPHFANVGDTPAERERYVAGAAAVFSLMQSGKADAIQPYADLMNPGASPMPLSDPSANQNIAPTAPPQGAVSGQASAVRGNAPSWATGVRVQQEASQRVNERPMTPAPEEMAGERAAVLDEAHSNAPKVTTAASQFVASTSGEARQLLGPLSQKYPDPNFAQTVGQFFGKDIGTQTGAFVNQFSAMGTALGSGLFAARQEGMAAGDAGEAAYAQFRERFMQSDYYRETPLGQADAYSSGALAWAREYFTGDKPFDVDAANQAFDAKRNATLENPQSWVAQSQAAIGAGLVSTIAAGDAINVDNVTDAARERFEATVGDMNDNFYASQRAVASAAGVSNPQAQQVFAEGAQKGASAYASSELNPFDVGFDREMAQKEQAFVDSFRDRFATEEAFQAEEPYLRNSYQALYSAGAQGMDKYSGGNLAGVGAYLSAIDGTGRPSEATRYDPMFMDDSQNQPPTVMDGYSVPPQEATVADPGTVNEPSLDRH